MKKIRFDNDQRRYLIDLRKKLGPALSDKNMTKIGAAGCGGVCYITCSYWCRSDVGSIMTSILDPH